MRDRAIFALALVAFLATALTTNTAGQQGAPAGRQGAPAPGQTFEPGGRGGRGAVQLPEGPGRDLVQANCTRCHGLNNISGSYGYTKDGWADRMATMVALPADQVNTISSYLAQHFPLKDAPGAVLISGPVSVTIKEYPIPTLGSRPHDSMAASDGSVWFTGMFSAKLGRLDPRTGSMREFTLPAGTQPHGLQEDSQGNIWYTGINKNWIGRLDPKTGATREYQLNEPKASNPHTPIINKRTGNIFFTMQSGHVGRINTNSGEMVIVKTPSDNTYPYGIRLDSQGTPWYVDFRGNRIGRINPQTMEVKEFTLPSPDARPRRIAITPDDMVYYTDFARGYIGRFDPKTGQVKEWQSPSGTKSEPYAITNIGNILWYSESGVRPNTLVRFDPATEKFQTWAVPSGGGVLRNFEATAQGTLVTANSGVNKIGVVEIGTLPPNRTN